MSATEWTEKQTNEVMKKVIRQAEVSRIARLIQHRLALATFKTQNGWQNLTLDAIEPKIDEDLKRKRTRSSELSPGPESSLFHNDLDWMRRNRQPAPESRPSSSASSVGPLPIFHSSRKRSHNSDYTTDAPGTKRHRSRKDGTGNDRRIQSSPGYYDAVSTSSSHQTQRQPRQQQPTFHSSPPRTPPRRMLKPLRPGTKPNGEAEGADLLLYLATSPSPATAAIPKSRFIPTTPPSTSSALPSSMMHTPGAPQTPHTGFNFADFVNITPSPAPALIAHAGRGTPIANARRRLDFDHMQSSRSPIKVPGNSNKTPLRSAPTGLGMELGGELVS
ncbi:hypothetical protein EX30DRAFT_269670 [Ascodesmis nigricans]|uniref:Uncharacterized protein n=1 Tax=Ascodesmis nigricans TaxID=341454 RepID=A0A4S2MX52_9PEZI|nr:hypothetical protein EX30DRAFT_269670 [Ascodesmis nigricans]